jgi:hypothetical protein
MYLMIGRLFLIRQGRAWVGVRNDDPAMSSLVRHVGAAVLHGRGARGAGGGVRGRDDQEPVSHRPRSPHIIAPLCPYQSCPMGVMQNTWQYLGVIGND